jgi:lipopolysaccharide biosynthesis glycosyltransferase
MSKFNVVYNIDSNYQVPFCVSLYSLLKFNNDAIDELYLLHDEASSRSTRFQQIKAFIFDQYQRDIIEVIISPERYNHYQFDGHVSSVAYYLFDLPQHLPTHLQRVLYIDPDTIVTSKLAHLSTAEFKKDEILLTVDHGMLPKERFVDTAPRLYRYFNTGVMYIDLSRWRYSTATKELWSLAINKPKEYLYWNQDIFNAVFWNSSGDLPAEYNWFYWKKRKQGTPAIIHFATNQKPWNLRCDNPYKTEYWKKWSKSPFFGPFEILIILISLLVSPLARRTYRLRRKLKLHQ